MSLKADGGALLGVDTSKESIRAAALDAERHGIEAEFEVGPAGEVLPARGWDETWDVAIVDPPRQGIRGSDLQALIAAQPRRIVYVGCHAGSLGRDCRHLLEAGWTPSELVPVDMLPQTPHTEWIAILDR
jgi:23S rRNA (uracil1939-C5)-methyltransferase